MRESDAQLIRGSAQSMIAKVAIQIHIRTRTQAQIAPALVVVHLGHDVARGKHTDLLSRIHG